MRVELETYKAGEEPTIPGYDVMVEYVNGSPFSVTIELGGLILLQIGTESAYSALRLTRPAQPKLVKKWRLGMKYKIDGVETVTFLGYYDESHQAVDVGEESGIPESWIMIDEVEV